MKSTISQWNEASLRYSEDQQSSRFAAANRKAVEQRFSKVQGLDILDLGCGDGWYSGMLAAKGALVMGCDGSQAMLDLARRNHPERRFILQDITKPLEIPANSFDIVLCNQVLMDIDPFETAIDEAARTLKPGGTLWFSIVHPAFYDGEWQAKEQGVKDRVIIRRYLSEYSFENNFWGETRHYHRPLCRYLNAAAKAGLVLVNISEPEAYDGVNKTKEIPLFIYAEFQKPAQQSD